VLPLSDHIKRSMELMGKRVIPGTALAAYGLGDWNDSLQPAKPEMRDHLCSSWTVTLHYQTCRTLADAYEKIGLHKQAEDLRAQATGIREQFQKILVVDGVVAGLMYFHPDGNREALLHPHDRSTGLSYSLLPIIHGIINDMFTPQQAVEHLRILRDHLLGPDGARLFDHPLKYNGGSNRNFQRAETASYFGREIGLMYTHAHIRYTEALAHYGDAPGLFHALRQINPIGLQDIVPSAALRQRNCYYSSSDAAFSDRYEAYEKYDAVSRGEIPLEGGWRVYSSGSGIAVRVILQCFLGIRSECDHVIIDPVIDPSLSGLRVVLPIVGHRWQVQYFTGARGHSAISITANGEIVNGNRIENPYRPGGLKIPMIEWQRLQRERDNQLLIVLE
jgi:1,2-beta-oligoglucan phosphorylase